MQTLTPKRLEKAGDTGCSCGRGAAGKARPNSEYCKTYKSRCPCYRAFRTCNDHCSCRSCGNPFGRNIRDRDVREPLPRKRAKQDFQQDVKETDQHYVERKAEEFIVPRILEDEEFAFEALIFCLLVSKKDTSIDNISSIYKKMLEFHTEMKIHELSLRPKSSAVISKKIEDIKAKIQVDEEFFKR